MNLCPRPLDSIDAEALACGGEPPFAADAAAHAALCVPCGALVARSRALIRALEALSGAVEPLPDLADRVTRLRPFSVRERRTYALWRAPVLLSGALGAAGLALLVGPALTSGEQAGLGAAALGPVIALLRSLARWGSDLAGVAPSGLDALSDALAGQPSLGLVSLLVLLPSALGLTRVFSRARSRR